MAGQVDNDRIGNVAPGDVISLRLPDRPEDGRQYKVVHKEEVKQTDSNESASSSTIVVTLEGDEGETLDVELPADTVVRRALESKWESAQSPTPHQGS